MHDSTYGYNYGTAMAMDAASRTPLPWKSLLGGPRFQRPSVEYSSPFVNSLATLGSTLYVGGDFTCVNGESHSGFAQFDAEPAAPESSGGAAAGAHAITWMWTDSSQDEDGFKVYVDPGTGTPTTLRTTTEANVEAWTQTGLEPNSLYTFTVCATSYAGDGARTSPVSARTAIEAVSALNFEAVATNAMGVAPAGSFTGLSEGNSGVRVRNATTGADAGWRQDTAAASFTGLSPNTAYAFEGASRNADGLETVPVSATRYTLANPPTAPVVSAPGPSRLSVAVGAGDENPASTLYALKVSPPVQDKAWVQADGRLGSAPAFQTAAAWGTVAVTGLLPQTPYAFAAVARNGDGVETAPGPEATGTTLEGVPGDVDGSGTVNATDVQTVINAALGLPVTANADINGDGRVDATDVQLVINAVLNQL